MRKDSLKGQGRGLVSVAGVVGAGRVRPRPLLPGLSQDPGRPLTRPPLTPCPTFPSEHRPGYLPSLSECPNISWSAVPGELLCLVLPPLTPKHTSWEVPLNLLSKVNF